jgi:hypothetical protein
MREVNPFTNASSRTRLAARKAGLITPTEYTASSRRGSLPDLTQEETDIM